jgi:4-aminobutyrate aminotransferase-like enzyme
MKDQGVLVGKGGLEGNTLRIQPPMCWTVQDADRTVAALEQALKDA